MAKKKSFSIGSSLTRALTDTVVAAQNYPGELHVEVLPLRKIELDPENPRDLALSISDLDNLDPHDLQYQRKLSERESLQSMANSIIEQGIINPILVYKHGEKYRLIAGERRTLASIIAGKMDIPAKIMAEKPNPFKLSLLQWIENVEREDLSLWERMRNLEKILQAYAEQQHKPSSEISATELRQIIGCSLQQAVNYRNLLCASPKLRLLIQDNQLKNIEKIAVIAKAPDFMQDLLIDRCLKGVTLKELKRLISMQGSLPIPEPELEPRGRQASQVNFGTTRNLHAAKIILQAVLKDENFLLVRKEIGNIVWEDYKSVTSAFKLMLKKLEKIAP